MHASVNLELNDEPNLSLDGAKKIAEKTVRRKINWIMRNAQMISETLGGNWNRANTILIGVDTIVYCNGKILDRPLLVDLHLAGPQHIEQARISARKMLMEERGQTIYIVTSLAVTTANDHQNIHVKTGVTEAKLRFYSEDDIDKYLLNSEPFDKAGAFGLQEKGVSLFTKIKGSYTNVVGLPLEEFVPLLAKNYGNIFALPELKSSLGKPLTLERAVLSVACVGDINYDYIYDKFPENFFTALRPPGKKTIGEIHRAVGGTAVNFAKGAKRAGFSQCYVVGIVGGDALGEQIQTELNEIDIIPIFPSNANQKTSIAIIFRDIAREDTSITITDAHQSLPEFLVGLATDTIRKSDVFYCSGYCLTDQNRRASALKMMEIAKQAKQLVVLDVVVDMQHEVIDELTTRLNDGKKGVLVDVIASELPEIFAWFQLDAKDKVELEVWRLHEKLLVRELRKKFQVAILRTSNYTDEIIVTPDEVIGPVQLNYKSLEARQKVGYGDFRTAKQMHSFLSPRIVLASKSPQRLALLSQIIAPSKIEAVVSNLDEKRVA